MKKGKERLIFTTAWRFGKPEKVEQYQNRSNRKGNQIKSNKK